MIEMRTFRLHFDSPNAANFVRISPLAVLSLCAKLMRNHGEHLMSTAAVQTYSLMTWLPLAAILLAVSILIKWGRQNRHRDTKRLNQLDTALASIREQLFLVSTESVPERSIVKTIGFVESMSGIEATSDADYLLAEREALLELGRQALAMGANAIVGLRKTNTHYDQAGSQWRVSRVTYLGTAVVVKSQS
jgi:uncharacterized protein YbjQ (UPF0145 family)